MINLSEIDYLKDQEFYYEVSRDIAILNLYFPKFKWCIDNEYTGTLRLDSTNTTLNIRVYWDKQGDIVCLGNDFKVAVYCTMEETCEELTKYLVNQWLVKE